jgi:hypothetical protein
VRTLFFAVPDLQPEAERRREAMSLEDTRHHDALTTVSGAASHLVQQWAEVSADGRNHLLSNLAKSLRNLKSVEVKLGIEIDEVRACTGCNDQCSYCRSRS